MPHSQQHKKKSEVIASLFFCVLTFINRSNIILRSDVIVTVKNYSLNVAVGCSCAVPFCFFHSQLFENSPFCWTWQELHSETLAVLSDLENWSVLDWAGLNRVQVRLPPVREKLRDMSHCLSDCWTTLDNTQRLLSTLTEVRRVHSGTRVESGKL